MATVDPELEKLRLQKEMAELQYRREKEEREAKLALEKEHTYRMTAHNSGPTIVNNNNNNNNNNNGPSVIAIGSTRPKKDLTTAYVACAVGSLFGLCGMHRCYLGDSCIGCLQCITYGGLGIWAIIDVLQMESLVDAANGGTTSVVVTR